MNKSKIPFYNFTEATKEHREQEINENFFTENGIGVFSNNGLKESFEPNRMDFFVIALNRNGYAHKDIGLIHYEIKPLTIHFLSPGTLHNLSSLSEDIDGYYICFQQAFYNRFCADKSWLMNLHFYASEGTPLFQLDQFTFEKIEKCMEHIVLEQQALKEYSYEFMWTYLHQIHLEAIRFYHENLLEGKESIGGKKDSLTDVFKKLVDIHFIQKRQVTEYAEAMNLTPQYLSELIHQHTGASPLYWIHKRMFLEMKYYLHHTNLSLKEIAIELDFSSSAHFSKFFKKMSNGLTPSQFKEHLKN